MSVTIDLTTLQGVGTQYDDVAQTVSTLTSSLQSVNSSRGDGASDEQKQKKAGEGKKLGAAAEAAELASSSLAAPHRTSMQNAAISFKNHRGAAQAVSYEPSLNWFESHMYYTSAMTPFFSSADAILNKMRENAIEGSAVASGLATLKNMYGPQSNSNLRHIHRGLIQFVAVDDGTIAISDISDFIAGIVSPIQTETVKKYVAPWISKSVLSLPMKGKNPSERVMFSDLMELLADLFCGSRFSSVVDVCFALCDPGNTGYILKDVMRALRGSEEDAVETDLTFVVVKAIMRAFEQVATIEEEKIRAAAAKGKKKKKGGNVPMPSVRQFHINKGEFSTLLAEDAHLVIAFLPYTVKTIALGKLVSHRDTKEKNGKPSSSTDVSQTGSPTSAAPNPQEKDEGKTSS